jgi:hypothetical protein
MLIRERLLLHELFVQALERPPPDVPVSHLRVLGENIRAFMVLIGESFVQGKGNADIG